MCRRAIFVFIRLWVILASPEFCLAEVEVAELIEAPIESLLDPATARVEEWEIPGRIWPVPFYQFGPHKVWGATAMILAELVAMLE